MFGGGVVVLATVWFFQVVQTVRILGKIFYLAAERLKGLCFLDRGHSR